MHKLRLFLHNARTWRGERDQDLHSIEQSSPLKEPSTDLFHIGTCCENVRDESTVRYRKSRATVGNSEREHWSEKNVAHTAAFEDDVEGVVNYKDQAFNDYDPPGTNVVPHRNPKSEDEFKRSAIHFAALGGAVHAVELLAPNYKSKSYDGDVLAPVDTLNQSNGEPLATNFPLDPCDDQLRPIHIAAQFGGLKNTLRSTNDAKRLAIACLEPEDGCVDVPFEYDTTSLHFACLAGNAPVVEELLERGANVNAVQRVTLMTPLMMAAQADSKEIALLLLKHKANPEMIDAYGNTVLHFAVSGSDDAEMLKILIEAVPTPKRDAFVCQRDIVGVAALRLAIEENKIKTAEYLLSQHVAHHNHKHEELMVHLAAQRQNPEMVALLCQNGWLTETRDNRGQTPLHFAAITNQVPLVRQLLALSANLEARDDAGFTPLLAAAAYDSIDVIKYLIVKDRAQLTALTYVGENLALIAVRRNAVKTIKYLYGNRDMHKGELRTLLTSLLTQPDLFRDTTLHYAAINGNLDIFKAILPYFTNINIRNGDLQTPLHNAARCDRVEIARRLLRTSVVSINLADKNNATPLFLAVSRSSVQMIQVLLANGADPMTQVEKRQIPLDIAIRDGNLEVVELLLDEINSEESSKREVYPLHEAVKRKQPKILRMLLKKEYARIDQVDNRNYTCLDMAIERHNAEAVQVILEHPDVLKVLRRRVPTEPGTFPELSPMQSLIKNLPHMVKQVLDMFETQFSQDLTHNYMFLDDTYYIPNINNEDCTTLQCHTDTNFDTYIDIKTDPHLREDAVVRSKSYQRLLEDHPITLMLQYRQYDLLTHPVVESYISMKWNATKKFYYSLMIFQSVFVGVLTAITVNIKPENVMNESDMQYYSEDGNCLTEGWKHYLWIFIFLQIVLGSTKTVRDGRFKGFIDFVLAGLTATIAWPLCGYQDTQWQWRFIVLLNFFVWLNLINYVRRVPRFGVYVLMVWHTCKSFIRFSPVFLMFLAPFVVSFHVLLGKERGFTHLLTTAVRTVVMMTGEFDYTDTIGSKNNALTYIMFFFFLFIGTVFLMNLLVGLAVSDTEKTLEKATRTRIRLQVATIHHVEILFPPKLRRKIWRGFKKFKTNDDCERVDKREESSCGDIWKIVNYVGMSKKTMKKEMSNNVETATTPTSPRPDDGHSHTARTARKKQEAELLEIRQQLFSLNEIKSSLDELVEASKKRFAAASMEEISEEDNALNQGSGRSNPEMFSY